MGESLAWDCINKNVESVAAWDSLGQQVVISNNLLGKRVLRDPA